ncbi:MAG: hypothetical protein HKN08_04650 [Gammaproteobacteria bacterium]|nr:hypothetical protein [Gammaproteobacteria bacterium]
MDNSEAIELLDKELDKYKEFSYSKLKTMISAQPIGKEVRTYNDADYNIEVIIDWNEKPDGNIKVLAYVEDGEMRSFIPLSKQFIKTPEDTFLEE